MKRISLVALIACAVVACSKDKFKTQPQIEIKSYNTKVVAPSQNLVITLHFTDKQGDISNGEFVFFPVRTNLKPPPPNTTTYDDSVSRPIPQFPDNTQGEIQFTLPYSYLHISSSENDSLYLKFTAVDRAGNKSDTIQSDNIVVLYQ